MIFKKQMLLNQVHSGRRPRIGLLGVVHETNTFEPGQTAYEAFAAPADREPILHGDELLQLEGGPTVFGGALMVLRQAQVELVPLYRAAAAPSAMVCASAWDRLLSECMAMLEQAGPLDGLLVELHGAMVAQGVADCEGALLAALRLRVGPDCAMVAALDFHANVSAAMVAHTHQLVPFRTYPHVDMRETGQRAAHSLLAALGACRTWEAAAAWSQGSFLIPLVSQFTGEGPMAQFMQASDAVSRRYGVDVAFCAEFPLADTSDTGPSVVVYPHVQSGGTSSSAQLALAELVGELNRLRTGFANGALDVAAAMQHIQPAPQGLTILADVADNPGAGCAADDLSLLCALHDSGIAHSLVATLNLPHWAARAHETGLGARMQQSLPGRAQPIELRVLALSDGRYRCSGAMWGGRWVQQGLTARLAWGAVELIVASRPVQALDPGALSCVGADPRDYGVIALKSSVHFRAAYGPLAQHVINVDIRRRPGQPEGFPPYRHLRPGLALSPTHLQTGERP